MGQLQRPGNPQAYGYPAADVIVNGSFAVWDPTATAKGAAGAYGAARPLSAGIGSSGAFFLGVWQGQQPPSSNIDNNNPLEPFLQVLVQRAGLFSFKTTNAETYVHATPVYARAAGDDLTVTTDSSGNTLVGYVNLPDGSQVTGATGVTIQIELNQNITKQTNALLSA